MLPIEVKKRFIIKAEQVKSNCSCKGAGCPQCAVIIQKYLRLAGSNIPLKFWDLEIEDFHGSEKVKEKIVSYVKKLNNAYNKGIGLFLQGQNGRGKSMIAAIILKAALQQGRTSYMTTLSDAVTMFAGSWYDRGIEEEFKYNVISSDFLVIDELGKEFRSVKKGDHLDMVDAAFYSFFKRRADLYLPTIICSNKRIEEVEQSYGKSLLALFDEHMITIRFEGKDFRKVIAPKLEQEVFDGTE